MIGIIIQARMTSKRFPGKPMAYLAGKPVLAHVIERCKKVTLADKVVVAMPMDKKSEPMGELCKELDVDTFYGPEKDVLTRYYLAATYFDFKTIMRITADCPFIDPIVCSEVLSLLRTAELDYCSNVHPIRTYPKGLDCEAFTFDCLEAAHMLTKHRNHREHVTPFMQRHGDIKRACVRQKFNMSSENWCVDYEDDIKRLEGLINARAN